MLYTDRSEAGRRLEARLPDLAGNDVVVLGLPRGGVPVAYEVARLLGAPLDVIVVRKLGVPFCPESAMGAIAEDGVRVLNADVIREAGITDAEVAVVERRERAELEARARRLRSGRPRLSLDGRTVVVVDDGVATGTTTRAACRAARARGAGRLLLAAPVGAPDAVKALRTQRVADEVVCPMTPIFFYAVGGYYLDFSPVPDETIVNLLATANHTNDPAARRSVPE
ncbi:phosphoribosyltransferase [Spirillospora sp. NPDC048911]|uniref:phosphoribosyltransferase n=1 Tax=Spirillospora sp. NPDC048911 TaxID=3364527 RepID=UPI0037207B10